MLQAEFETITGCNVSDEDYETIEFVYMYHPAIDCKQQIADIYTAGGMQVIKDMINTAARGKQLWHRRKELQDELNKIDKEWTALHKGGEYECT